MIVPAENSETCATELSHVNDWAERNNLRLNCTKIKEIVFWAKGKQGCAVQISPPCNGIESVCSLTALGVVINDRLTATEYRQHQWVTSSDQQCWSGCCTARLRGRASAQQLTMRDSMHSCAGVSDSGTAAERRQRLPNCLMKLTSRCLAAY